MPHEATSFSTLLDLYKYFFENDLIVSLRPVTPQIMSIKLWYTCRPLGSGPLEAPSTANIYACL